MWHDVNIGEVKGESEWVMSVSINWTSQRCDQKNLSTQSTLYFVIKLFRLKPFFHLPRQLNNVLQITTGDGIGFVCTSPRSWASTGVNIGWRW
jgi:hypothetical protein